VLVRYLAILIAATATAAEILEHITVYRDDTLYHITPWLMRLSNGDLIVTAREAH
jgi:hypothetical protein